MTTPDLAALRALMDLLRRELRRGLNPLQDLLLADERSLAVRIVAILPAAQEALERVEQSMKMFPIQSTQGRACPTRIPWSIADKAYSAYRANYGDGQSLERLAERGGFCPEEMDLFYPAWEQEASGLAAFKARLARLEEALRNLVACRSGDEDLCDCRAAAHAALEGRDA